MTGWVDVHCHGGAGIELTGETDPTPTLDLHARHGTAALIASLAPAPLAVLESRLTALAAYRAAHPDTILAGVHLEGPFVAATHCGALDPRHLLFPDDVAVARLLEAGAGLLRQITIAPELPGALDTIARCTAAGVRVAIGHTGADYSLAREAFAAGATLLTHTFNAMPPLHHRSPGPIGAALDTDTVTLEVIADGIHVAPTALRLLFAAAPGRIAAITDACPAAGLPEAPPTPPLTLGGQPIEPRDGAAYLTGTDTLAGSTLTMDRAVATLTRAGIPAEQIHQATNTTPARALGLDIPSPRSSS